MFDLDLPPEQRTQANYWQARYFEAYKELVNANRGIKRLRKKLENGSHRDCYYFGGCGCNNIRLGIKPKG